MSKLKFIDLFSGCGGFSEGFYQEGFESIVHVDFDAPACETVKERMRFYNYTEKAIENAVICGDLTSDEVHKQIDDAIGDTKIDILVGGPPCQSFSSVGRAQDSNSMRNDPRNYLFRSYLEILEKHEPKIFVFENVSGLLSAKPNGNYIFPEIIESMSEYYSVCDDRDTILLNSVHYGVPQIRKRVILIGVRKDLNINAEDVYKEILKTHYSPEMEIKNEILNRKKYLTVKDAILDLPKLQPGEGEEEVYHKIEKKNAYLKLMRPNGSTKLFNHVARKHNDLDRERYKLLSKNNWQLKELAEVRPDLIHHDPKHFGNRYTVQTASKPGKTVVAHLYKDGNLFIHPDYKQGRTFTVREAARIQSFPDWYFFTGSTMNQFKQIGNAVPPLLGGVFAEQFKSILDRISQNEK
jgi:DNA (cytosine-5)-methyltransferase 1